MKLFTQERRVREVRRREGGGREEGRDGGRRLVIILRDFRACMQSQPGMAVCPSGHFLSLGTCKLSGMFGSLYVSWLLGAAFCTSSTAGPFVLLGQLYSL